ncbi:hypothetical protein GCM10027610_137970 [Dactylosporangium cerinum]
MPGASDPLQAGGDARGRLDLHDEVDGAHVDAQLQAGGGDDGRQLAGLEGLLDVLALLAGDAAVVRAGHDRRRAVGGPGLRHHLGRRPWRGGRGDAGAGCGQLVDPGAEPLGAAPRVGEHDGGAVALDQVEHALLHGGPDGGLPRCAVVVLRRVGLAEGRHVLDGHLDLDLDGLGAGRLHDLDGRGPAEEPGGLVDRADGRGQPDPLRRPLQQGVEPLQGEREVRAALGRADRVDLVDDHRLDAAQGLPGLRGEQQEQGLGRGDQDVGRGLGEGPPLVGRGVAGAHGDPDVGRHLPEPGGGLPDAGERCPEIALDVDRQGLQWADIEHPAALRGLHVGPGGELVERPEERRQGLAGAGRRDHEGVPVGADRPPGAGLRRGRRRERRTEPLPRRRPEPTQLIHASILPPGYDTFPRPADPADRISPICTKGEFG